MNHPTREAWMAYLYREAGTAERAELASHLARCPECAAQLETYRRGARALDSWRLPFLPRRRPVFQPVLRWAAAAALILAIGIGIGRTTRRDHLDAAALRQELRAEFAQLLRRELGQSSAATLAASESQTRQWIGEYARYAEENRAHDTRGLYSALAQLETRRLAEYAALRQDLETVAVFSDAGLRQTQERLVQLADYQPSTTPIPQPISPGNN